jgi:hypothetical protein
MITADTHNRVRTGRLDANGTVTLRHSGRLYHIGTGRAHARTCVLLLIQDLHIRVINAATGELLRELTLDPPATTSPSAADQGPTAGAPRPPGNRRTPNPDRGFGVIPMSCDITWLPRPDSNGEPAG